MKRILLIILSTITLCSCGDFLEPKSQHEFVPETVEVINEMLLGSAYLSDINVGCMGMSDFLSDDVSTLNTYSFESSLGSNESKLQYLEPIFGWNYDAQIVKDNNVFDNTYKNLYKKIMGCNAALDYVDDCSGTDNERAFAKGQALFLRSFYYFMLVNFYAPPYASAPDALGVPLRLESTLEDYELTRNTVKDVYERIITDLTTAENLFLSLPITTQRNKNFKVSLPVIQLIKSRVLLYMERWDEAAVYAKKVITDWDFSLYDLNSFIQSSSEPYYSNFTTFQCPETIWAWGLPSDFLSNGCKVLYSTLSASKGSYVWTTPSESLLSLYTTDDLRKANYILTESRTHTNLVCRGKIRVSNKVAVTTSEVFGHAIRLPEAYLNYAEACLLKPEKDEEQALWALEKLRKSKFKEGSVYEVPADKRTGEALLQFCREERRRELCFEGHRWMDLRRQGMPSFSRTFDVGTGETTSYTLQKNDPAYTFPIPSASMDANPALIQNEISGDHQSL